MDNTETNKYIVPLAIVLAGAMIAGAIYMGGQAPSGGRGAVADDPTEIDIEKVSSRDHILGDPSAPVVIVEYSDTECPFCKVFHNTMKDVVRAYDGEVAWVYRHFPIAQLHAKATAEAIATECAAEQGGNTIFWNYINTIFETTNSNDSLDLAELPKIAAELGLDVGAFNDCMESGKYDTFIKDSVDEAINAGARGTPYSVIITEDGPQGIINGAESFASVKAKIDALLQ